MQNRLLFLLLLLPLCSFTQELDDYSSALSLKYGQQQWGFPTGQIGVQINDVNLGNVQLNAEFAPEAEWVNTYGLELSFIKKLGGNRRSFQQLYFLSSIQVSYAFMPHHSELETGETHYAALEPRLHLRHDLGKWGYLGIGIKLPIMLTFSELGILESPIYDGVATVKFNLYGIGTSPFANLGFYLVKNRNMALSIDGTISYNINHFLAHSSQVESNLTYPDILGQDLPNFVEVQDATFNQQEIERDDFKIEGLQWDAGLSFYF